MLYKNYCLQKLAEYSITKSSLKKIKGKNGIFCNHFKNLLAKSKCQNSNK